MSKQVSKSVLHARRTAKQEAKRKEIEDKRAARAEKKRLKDEASAAAALAKQKAEKEREEKTAAKKQEKANKVEGAALKNDILDGLASELAVLIESERNNVIDIGAVLLRAKAELEHGNFGKWVEDSAGYNIQTAENYMHSARLAAKFKTVLILKLASTAIYQLGRLAKDDENDALLAAVMKEVEAVAKDKWTSHRAVVDIIAACERKLAPKGVHDDPPDGKDEGKPATKTKPTPVKDDEDDEEQDEVEENLDKSTPPSPPASQGPLNNFETAFGLIDKLVSKPLSTFAPTSVSADNIERAGNFLLAVANAKRGGKKAA